MLSSLPPQFQQQELSPPSPCDRSKAKTANYKATRHRRHSATEEESTSKGTWQENGGQELSIGVRVADCTAKHELDSYSGISEAPSNVVAAFFAAAAPVLDLYTVAGVKLMHSIQFLAKAAFRDEHFHYIWITSLCGFRSRGTFAEHGS